MKILRCVRPAHIVFIGVAGLIGAGHLVAFARSRVVTIPREAAVNLSAAHGLKVAYYDFERVNPVGAPGIDSLDIAEDFVADHEPDLAYELNAPYIDFPPGEKLMIFAKGRSVGDYLGAPVIHEMSSRNIFVYTGFINVRMAGTYNFRIACDDGDEMTIGGVVVHAYVGGGMYAPIHRGYLARVEFVAPGIYPVQILHYDMAKHIGIEVYSDLIPNGEARNFGPRQTLYLLPFLTLQQ